MNPIESLSADALEALAIIDVATRWDIELTEAETFLKEIEFIERPA